MMFPCSAFLAATACQSGLASQSDVGLALIHQATTLLALGRGDTLPMVHEHAILARECAHRLSDVRCCLRNVYV